MTLSTLTVLSQNLRCWQPIRTVIQSVSLVLLSLFSITMTAQVFDEIIEDCEPSISLICADDLTVGCEDNTSPEALNSVPTVEVEDCGQQLQYTISFEDNAMD